MGCDRDKEIVTLFPIFKRKKKGKTKIKMYKKIEQKISNEKGIKFW